MNAAAISPELQKFARSVNNAPPRHFGRRYDAAGTFLPEPGNTVVSHLVSGSRSQAALAEVRRRLMAMPEAGQFAFTPLSSLHMTLFQGTIEFRRMAPYWPQDVPNDATIDETTAVLSARLADFAPPGAFRVHATQVTPLGLVVEGVDAADREMLAAWRDRFADIFGYRHPDHDTYVFHITLAYVIDWLADEALPRWQAMLDGCLDYLRAEAPVIELAPPAFCTFEDMNHFEEILVFDPSEHRERRHG